MDNRFTRSFLVGWMLTLVLASLPDPIGSQLMAGQMSGSAPASQENRSTSPGDTGAAAQSPEEVRYGTEAVVLVALLFILLGGLFYLLLSWSHRLDQASYLGEIYKESVEDFEYKRLTCGPKEKFLDGGYHREIAHSPDWLKAHPEPTPPPEWRTSTSMFAGESGDMYSRFRDDPDRGGDPTDGTTQPPGIAQDPPEDPAEYRERLEAYKKWRAETASWRDAVSAEANRQYKEAMDKAEKEAENRADSAMNVDLSALRGRGAEFVLEFTTVVVIIFATVVLGILHVLKNEQIGTLLAAIAGYVLGRATTRARSAVAQVPAGGERLGAPTLNPAAGGKAQESS